MEKHVYLILQRISFKTSSALIKHAKKPLCKSNRTGSEKTKCHMVTKRCTRQLALTAEKNVMFLSSQTEQGQFTAENATANEDHQEDIKLLS
jgi:hypothetical protein